MHRDVRTSVFRISQKDKLASGTETFKTDGPGKIKRNTCEACTFCHSHYVHLSQLLHKNCRCQLCQVWLSSNKVNSRCDGHRQDQPRLERCSADIELK